MQFRESRHIFLNNPNVPHGEAPDREVHSSSYAGAGGGQSDRFDAERRAAERNERRNREEEERRRENPDALLSALQERGLGEGKDTNMPQIIDIINRMENVTEAAMREKTPLVFQYPEQAGRVLTIELGHSLQAGGDYIKLRQAVAILWQDRRASKAILHTFMQMEDAPGLVSVLSGEVMADGHPDDAIAPLLSFIDRTGWREIYPSLTDAQSRRVQELAASSTPAERERLEVSMRRAWYILDKASPARAEAAGWLRIVRAMHDDGLESDDKKTRAIAKGNFDRDLERLGTTEFTPERGVDALLALPSAAAILQATDNLLNVQFRDISPEFIAEQRAALCIKSQLNGNPDWFKRSENTLRDFLQSPSHSSRQSAQLLPALLSPPGGFSLIAEVWERGSPEVKIEFFNELYRKYEQAQELNAELKQNLPLPPKDADAAKTMITRALADPALAQDGKREIVLRFADTFIRQSASTLFDEDMQKVRSAIAKELRAIVQNDKSSPDERSLALRALGEAGTDLDSMQLLAGKVCDASLSVKDRLVAMHALREQGLFLLTVNAPAEQVQKTIRACLEVMGNAQEPAALRQGISVELTFLSGSMLKENVRNLDSSLVPIAEGRQKFMQEQVLPALLQANIPWPKDNDAPLIDALDTMSTYNVSPAIRAAGVLGAKRSTALAMKILAQDLESPETGASRNRSSEYVTPLLEVAGKLPANAPERQQIEEFIQAIRPMLEASLKRREVDEKTSATARRRAAELRELLRQMDTVFPPR